MASLLNLHRIVSMTQQKRIFDTFVCEEMQFTDDTGYVFALDVYIVGDAIEVKTLPEQDNRKVTA
jgi:hypothetical protein